MNDYLLVSERSIARVVSISWSSTSSSARDRSSWRLARHANGRRLFSSYGLRRYRCPLAQRSPAASVTWHGCRCSLHGSASGRLCRRLRLWDGPRLADGRSAAAWTPGCQVTRPRPACSDGAASLGSAGLSASQCYLALPADLHRHLLKHSESSSTLAALSSPASAASPSAPAGTASRA